MCWLTIPHHDIYLWWRWWPKGRLVTCHASPLKGSSSVISLEPLGQFLYQYFSLHSWTCFLKLLCEWPIYFSQMGQVCMISTFNHDSYSNVYILFFQVFTIRMIGFMIREVSYSDLFLCWIVFKSNNIIWDAQRYYSFKMNLSKVRHGLYLH